MTHFMPDNSDHAATPIGLLSASIRREREKLGLTVTELAKRAGIAKSTLSQLEGGAGNPSLETLWSLAMHWMFRSVGLSPSRACMFR